MSRYKYNKEDYKKVVTYFENYDNNSSKFIADKFNFHINYVNWILNLYMSGKKTYKGKKIIINNKKPKDIKIKKCYFVIYVDNKFIGMFNNLSRPCEEIFDISSSYVYKKIKGKTQVTIKNKRINKEITFIKVYGTN